MLASTTLELNDYVFKIGERKNWFIIEKKRFWENIETIRKLKTNILPKNIYLNLIKKKKLEKRITKHILVLLQRNFTKDQELKIIKILKVWFF